MLHIFATFKITKKLTQVDNYFWERKERTMTENYALKMDFGFIFNVFHFSGSIYLCIISINDNSNFIFLIKDFSTSVIKAFC